MLIAVILGGVSFSADAQQQRCRNGQFTMLRDTVVDTLADKFGERPTSRGLAANGSMLEVLSGPDGSWTIIVTSPAMQTCVLATGEGWTELEPVILGSDS